jgi:hypothetical protein
MAEHSRQPGPNSKPVEADLLDGAVRHAQSRAARKRQRAGHGDGGLRAAADGLVVPLEQEMAGNVRSRSAANTNRHGGR